MANRIFATFVIAVGSFTISYALSEFLSASSRFGLGLGIATALVGVVLAITGEWHA